MLLVSAFEVPPWNQKSCKQSKNDNSQRCLKLATKQI
jgi:hypothetical protein